MKRAVLILLAAFLAGALSYSLHMSVRGPEMPEHEAVFEDLRWLRSEFELSDEQYAAIEGVYREYRPVCEELCLRVIEARDKLNERLADATGFTPELDEALDRYTRVKQECHRAMMRHVYEVAAHMDPEQRERYVNRAIAHVTMHDPAR